MNPLACDVLVVEQQLVARVTQACGFKFDVVATIAAAVRWQGALLSSQGGHV
jgi:hypothetical protein